MILFDAIPRVRKQTLRVRDRELGCVGRELFCELESSWEDVLAVG